MLLETILRLTEAIEAITTSPHDHDHDHDHEEKP